MLSKQSRLRILGIPRQGSNSPAPCYESIGAIYVLSFFSPNCSMNSIASSRHFLATARPSIKSLPICISEAFAKGGLSKQIRSKRQLYTEPGRYRSNVFRVSVFQLIKSGCPTPLSERLLSFAACSAKGLCASRSSGENARMDGIVARSLSDFRSYALLSAKPLGKSVAVEIDAFSAPPRTFFWSAGPTAVTLPMSGGRTPEEGIRQSVIGPLTT
jgi:hypothetical protein